MRRNPMLEEFADRLKKAGKLPKVIIVAVMRKFISILNAVVRDGLSREQLDLVKTYDLSKSAAPTA